MNTNEHNLGAALGAAALGFYITIAGSSLHFQMRENESPTARKTVKTLCGVFLLLPNDWTESDTAEVSPNLLLGKAANLEKKVSGRITVLRHSGREKRPTPRRPSDSGFSQQQTRGKSKPEKDAIDTAENKIG